MASSQSETPKIAWVRYGPIWIVVLGFVMIPWLAYLITGVVAALKWVDGPYLPHPIIWDTHSVTFIGILFFHIAVFAWRERQYPVRLAWIQALSSVAYFLVVNLLLQLCFFCPDTKAVIVAYLASIAAAALSAGLMVFGPLIGWLFSLGRTRP